MGEATVNAMSATYEATGGAGLGTDLEEMQQTQAEVQRLRAQVARLETEVQTLHRAPALRSGGYALPPDDGREQAALKAFTTFVRTGLKAAMQEDTVGEGGYLVPTRYSTDLVAALAESSIVRKAGARVLTVQGTTSFKVPTMTHSTAAVLTSEEGAFDEAEPTFSEVEFSPYKYTKLVKVSDELLADSRIDVMQQVIAPDAAQAFAAAENSAFTSGTGSGQPQGVVAGSSLGVTAASATAVAADEVLDLFYSLGYLYRQNAVWLMNDGTLKLVRKLTDSNEQYLWQPGLEDGQPDRLLGRPVYTLNAMDLPASGKKSIIFGDMSYFWIANFAALTVQRLDQLYAASGQVGFRFYHRVDSRVVLSTAIKHLVHLAGSGDTTETESFGLCGVAL